MMPSNFCESLLIAYKFERCLGLSEFTLGANTKTITKINAWGLYKATFYIAIISLTLTVIALHDIVEPVSSNNLLYWYVTLYDLHGDVLALLATVTWSKFRGTLLIETWNAAIAFDAKYPESASRNTNSIGRYALAWISLQGFLNVVLHAAADNIVSHQPMKFVAVSNVIYLWINLYLLSMKLSFQSWMLALKRKFAYINRALANTGHAFDPTIVAIYTELSEMTRSVNEIYSAPLLMCFGVDYFTAIFQVYYLAVILHKRAVAVKSLAVTGLWVSFCLINVLSVIATAALLAQEAQQLKKMLFKLMATNRDSVQRKEINVFALQLLHDQVKITAGGFLRVDFSLLFNMVSSGTTYLVILLQEIDRNNR